MKLSCGNIVRIGNSNYRVTDANNHSCKECDLKDCAKNKDFDKLLAKMHATSCVDLIPIFSCFKRV